MLMKPNSILKMPYLFLGFYYPYHVMPSTVYPRKYAHGFVVLCFVVVMQSFIMNSHEVFIHIHQGCFAGTGAIVRLPQCQRSKPDGYGKISQCITTTKHGKAKTVCIFLGIYCKCSIQTYKRLPACRFFLSLSLSLSLSIYICHEHKSDYHKWRFMLTFCFFNRANHAQNCFTYSVWFCIM